LQRSFLPQKYITTWRRKRIISRTAEGEKEEKQENNRGKIRNKRRQEVLGRINRLLSFDIHA
jgi:hypothetical protein